MVTHTSITDMLGFSLVRFNDICNATIAVIERQQKHDKEKNAAR